MAEGILTFGCKNATVIETQDRLMVASCEMCDVSNRGVKVVLARRVLNKLDVHVLHSNLWYTALRKTRSNAIMSITRFLVVHLVMTIKMHALHDMLCVLAWYTSL